MSVEQKEEILDLVQSHHTHHKISAEVRREIVNSECQDLGLLFKGGAMYCHARAKTVVITHYV